MPREPQRPLTPKQAAVMERIDRRVPIKVIANEMSVSETRINQHIRALKNIFEADSLNELVECYRATLPDEDSENNGLSQTEGGSSDKALSDSELTKSQLPEAAVIAQNGFRNDPGQIVMNDAMSLAGGVPFVGEAPWLRADEPRIVPGVLDGEHAVLFRLGAIVGIAFGILAAIVLTVTASLAISEALDGRLAVSVDEQSPAN